KVARLWEEEIGDPRESADAWRRVLRMKAADPEATAGLERAKTGNLKKAPPVYERPASERPASVQVPSAPPAAPPVAGEGPGEVTADGLPDSREDASYGASGGAPASTDG